MPDRAAMPVRGAFRPVVPVAVRWTLPVTGGLPRAVDACVAGAYTAWGAAEHQADLLADLAADFVTDVLGAAASPFVAVTAMLHGGRATLSVAPATVPAPPVAIHLPRAAATTMASSWGYVPLAHGLCVYAAVNLTVHRRRGQR
ncbi:hypothetical protein [Streptomyces gilvus]|uniref:hypothetical protein n=1 Tax=Streptomyces gilvus TaxID=2920937 RepID=UPI001F0DE17E|nr:hypothetical protein [Streptomyces sp. CME 23]MCH5677262.1 hypothetical protein [Streptomyces sp. CME 23]